ncbi:hypothetical protein BXZ70DRAFT_909534 [Cristinia sonorae]|uniref:Uncharacterized protein n=1 Tax=Cristinia sonorae TaxID=1940300 RepID=A0A8K0UJX8_9AGAR|nr:hypothetical protein BXZ70DRAFT_909534 [Cristinia sonorae]
MNAFAGSLGGGPDFGVGMCVLRLGEFSTSDLRLNDPNFLDTTYYSKFVWSSFDLSNLNVAVNRRSLGSTYQDRVLRSKPWSNVSRVLSARASSGTCHSEATRGDQERFIESESPWQCLVYTLDKVGLILRVVIYCWVDFLSILEDSYGFKLTSCNWEISGKDPALPARRDTACLCLRPRIKYHRPRTDSHRDIDAMQSLQYPMITERGAPTAIYLFYQKRDKGSKIAAGLLGHESKSAKTETMTIYRTYIGMNNGRVIRKKNEIFFRERKIWKKDCFRPRGWGRKIHHRYFRGFETSTTVYRQLNLDHKDFTTTTNVAGATGQHWEFDEKENLGYLPNDGNQCKATSFPYSTIGRAGPPQLSTCGGDEEESAVSLVVGDKKSERYRLSGVLLILVALLLKGDFASALRPDRSFDKHKHIGGGRKVRSRGWIRATVARCFPLVSLGEEIDLPVSLPFQGGSLPELHRQGRDSQPEPRRTALALARMLQLKMTLQSHSKSSKTRSTSVRLQGFNPLPVL